MGMAEGGAVREMGKSLCSLWFQPGWRNRGAEGSGRKHSYNQSRHLEQETGETIAAGLPAFSRHRQGWGRTEVATCWVSSREASFRGWGPESSGRKTPQKHGSELDKGVDSKPHLLPSPFSHVAIPLPPLLLSSFLPPPWGASPGFLDLVPLDLAKMDMSVTPLYLSPYILSAKVRQMCSGRSSKETVLSLNG